MDIKYGLSNVQLTGPISGGVCIRQAFNAQTSKLCSLSIFFATYKRKNPGLLILEIVDSSFKTVVCQTFDATKLRDNEYKKFDLNVDLVRGRRYELKLSMKAVSSGIAPTASYGVETGNLGYLFIGKRRVNGELTCNFNYDGNLMVIPSSGESKNDVSDFIPGLISVIVPNWQCHEYIADTLGTIAMQSYSAIEVVVVDDGSPEKNKVDYIVKTFESVLPSVKLLRNPQNQGAPFARNEGAKNSCGEYLFFCDADVKLYESALEDLLKCLIADRSLAFAYGGFLWDNRRIDPIQFDAKKLREGNYITTMSLLRREWFPGWDENLKRHQDWDLWLTVTENGGKGVCCNKYLFETPIRNNSISGAGSFNRQESENVIRNKHGIIK